MVKSRSAAPQASVDNRIHVPRIWLVLLGAAFVVPWLVVAMLYMRVAAPAIPAKDAETPAVPSERQSGPWGRLTTTPVIVSPPLEYVAADWGRDEVAGPWYFPSLDAEVVRRALESMGLPPESVNRLMASARHDPAIRGLVIVPDADIVRSLNAEVRARLYGQLARSRLNFDQAHAFRFLGSSPDEWFRGSLIRPKTRELVEPLIYRSGEFLHFADAELVRREIGNDTEELQRLAKTLLRQKALIVSLKVEDPGDVPALAEYWGRGGRRTDIRPLLESVAGTGQLLDIVHLLPGIARNHLYRYPRVTTADYAKPLLANCLWTSLNFFGETPDDRFLDVKTALNTLRTEYFIVEHGYQLGDVVGFVDDEGDLFHAAVYVADGLVFTKNGISPVAPWTIMPIDQVSGYYQRHASEQRLIYHRRKDH